MRPEYFLPVLFFNSGTTTGQTHVTMRNSLHGNERIVHMLLDLNEDQSHRQL